MEKKLPSFLRALAFGLVFAVTAGTGAELFARDVQLRLAYWKDPETSVALVVKNGNEFTPVDVFTRKFSAPKSVDCTENVVTVYRKNTGAGDAFIPYFDIKLPENSRNVAVLLVPSEKEENSPAENVPAENSPVALEAYLLDYDSDARFGDAVFYNLTERELFLVCAEKNDPEKMQKVEAGTCTKMGIGSGKMETIFLNMVKREGEEPSRVYRGLIQFDRKGRLFIIALDTKGEKEKRRQPIQVISILDKQK